MQKKKSFFPVFLVLFLISVFIFFLSNSGLLGGLNSMFETVTVPLQKAVFGIVHNPQKATSELSKLREDNIRLMSELAKQKELLKENQALRDQFETSNPTPRKLLPVRVIGMRGSQMTIDKGKNHGVEIRAPIVYKDNLIGQVEEVSSNVALVGIISYEASFTGKILESEAQGVVKGQNGSMLLDNVVLSDNLKKDNLVVTKGDVDNPAGQGIPPGLVVGKIVSINKKESNLFQTAEIKSLVDFSRLETVFVITTNNR